MTHATSGNEEAQVTQILRQQLSIRLPYSLIADIDQRAVSRGWTRTDVIEDAVRRDLGYGGLPWEGHEQRDLGEVVSREEFDEVAEIVRDLKRIAENAGAM